MLTPEEYLEIERRAERNSEYFQGQMFAMSGASRPHVLIVTNLVHELMRLDARPCEIYLNDMRLRVTANGLSTYPDVMVACGQPQFADDQSDTLLNPVLIIEARNLSNTRPHRVSISWSHRMRRASNISPQPDGYWLCAETTRIDAGIRLASIGCVTTLRSSAGPNGRASISRARCSP